jgi:uncharacterized protein
MSIELKVQAVEKLFAHLDNEISKFVINTSLSCKSGCGHCCTNPEIEASPLEFLPWAFFLFLNGEAEKVLEKLKVKSSSICHIYNPFTLIDSSSGNCGSYQYRGLICRLFGYGASADKYGKLRLVTCKIIKESQEENFQKAELVIINGLEIPVFTNYYMRLADIDFQLGNVILPINKALKMAIEEVLQYYAYRPLPDGIKNVA